MKDYAFTGEIGTWGRNAFVGVLRPEKEVKIDFEVMKASSGYEKPNRKQT